jgi:hypothetical protein
MPHLHHFEAGPAAGRTETDEMTDQPPDRDVDNAALTDEALAEELTIAASGTDEDPERENRFEDLLEEHEHRSDEGGGSRSPDS